MAEQTISERLNARIAAMDTEIDRVAKNAQAEIARLKERKVLLNRAKEALTPEREQLLETLIQEGVL